jgi:hypothetical protein
VWYPNGTVFWRQGGAAVVGFAEDVDEIYVSNAGVLAHELMHVHLWRLFPDSYGDYDHEDGEGPWTETTNAVVSEISALFKADPTLQSGAGGR